ncbi:low temperature requirement protein A [Acrocarpospora catenulata]|uniref:low temperature requirement protein A n=1 Tax=Acrocarpospora catenulata TaxID=2836182 RepID=UPI001BDAD2A9|nr:low temperature requirement protein A [Acrocarpospora catenulata]
MSEPAVSPERRPAWRQVMAGRSRAEGHRAATPLELLFDLCFVVGVAQAAASLHHALSEGHAGAGVLHYLMVFFAIWWAWMNFTWFASAYDTDDVPYRLLVLIQIVGVLILAAGVPRAFEHEDFGLITLGYAVMRLAMVALWLRAARENPAGRSCATRYAIGIAVVQAGWLARLALAELTGLTGTAGLVTFFALAAAELAVPLWAERFQPTTWHPHHIAERYGLFTIIVLGESILQATVAIQTGLARGIAPVPLLWVAVSGTVIVFAMWWLYFERPAHPLLTSNRTAFPWGYGHYLIFASAAAVGAGLAVSIDYHTHTAHVGPYAAAAATAVPVAVFLVSVWWVHIRPHHPGSMRGTLGILAIAAAIIAVPLLPIPLPLIALGLAGVIFHPLLRGKATG